MASVDDLWLVDFGDPFPGEAAWHRPSLVLGPPATFGEGFPFVIVLPLSTTDRGLSLHVEVEASEPTGLDRASYVLCEQIRSVNRRRLVHRLGTVDAETSTRVAGVVRTLLDL
jgi:mRNA interferase MazF